MISKPILIFLYAGQVFFARESGIFGAWGSRVDSCDMKVTVAVPILKYTES